MKKIYSTLLILFCAIITNAQILVRDIVLGSNSSNPNGYIEYNGKLYFTIYDQGQTYKYKLYRYDPNDNSVTLAEGQNYSFSAGIHDAVIYNNKLYFSILDLGINNKKDLFEYDANSQQLTKITNGLPNPNQSINPNELIVCNGNLYFTGELTTSHQNLFKFNSATNTITQVYINGQTTGPTYTQYLTQIDGILYFQAQSTAIRVFYYNTSTNTSGFVPGNIYSPRYLTAYGTSIYGVINDGTNDRFIKIDPLNNNATTFLSPMGNQLPKSNIIGHSNKLYFTCDEGSNNSLGIYDIASDTFQSKTTVSSDSQISYITKYGGKIFFSAFFTGSGKEVGYYDPVTDSNLLEAVNTSTLSGSLPTDLTPFNGDLFYTATNYYNGFELFKLNISVLSNEDFSNTEKISIYPNPVENIFIIDTTLELKYFEIYNLQGKLVKAFKNQNNYDISSLNSGIYIGKIETENNKNTFIKIIKK